MIAGAVVAGLPWFVTSLVPLGGTASIDGRMTEVDGHVTSFGIWVGLQVAAQIGIFGAIGGLVFWLVAGARTRRSSPLA